MPPSVEEAPGQKRKRKGAAKLQDFHQWYLAACAWGCGAAGLGLEGPGAARRDLVWCLLTQSSCRRSPH